MNSSDLEQLPPAIILHELIDGFARSQLIFVGAKLKIADHIANGIQTAGELAEIVEADPDALYRFLRALASLGVLKEDESRRFSLTPVGAYLRSDNPASMQALVTWAEEIEWEMWSRLEESVRTGRPAFEHQYGIGMFEYFRRNPDKEAVFNAAMTTFVARNTGAFLETYAFEPLLKIVDVGGGHGSLMMAILEANPGTTGVVFDQPGVVQGAEKRVDEAQLADRCECMSGDFFEAVPEGGDVYLLVSILHDWDDERCLAILKSCRLAMTEQAKVLIVEMVIPAGTEPSFVKVFDVNMLVLAGGRERSEVEYQRLLEAAGFRLERVIPTNSTVSIIEAAPD